jgi:hypothetical protein
VWPRYALDWTIGRTRYRFTVSNPDHRSQGVASAELDGAVVDPGAIPLQDDGGTHDVAIVMGTPAPVGMRGAAAGQAEQREGSS